MFDRKPAYGEVVCRRRAECGGALALGNRSAVSAVDLTDMASPPTRRIVHRSKRESRLCQALDAKSTNSNERGWLAAGIREAEARLQRRP
jgi:hypothetical protein